MDLNVNREYEEAEKEAKIKLAQIIEREGDANGERSKPYYLAQLILEALTVRRFASYYQKENHSMEIKKEMPAALSRKANLNPISIVSQKF